MNASARLKANSTSASRAVELECVYENTQVPFGFCVWMACAGVWLAFCAPVVALSAGQTAPQKADSILILKKDHLMELLAGGKVIRTYKVALGQGGLPPPRQKNGPGGARRGADVGRCGRGG